MEYLDYVLDGGNQWRLPMIVLNVFDLEFDLVEFWLKQKEWTKVIELSECDSQDIFDSTYMTVYYMFDHSAFSLYPFK